MLYTRVNQPKISEISLAKHKLWSIDGDRRGDVISCLSGTLWITQEGDLKDYVVEAGRNFWVTKSGSVVVQALQEAQFKYSLNELESHIESNSQPFRRFPRIRVSHLR